MKIVWFTWKDMTHPLAGGAEVVNEELAKRLVADGHEVIFVVGGYKGAQTKQTMPDGFQVIRLGNRVSVYWHAYRYYRCHLRGWPDLVIDEVNTVPFFAKFYAGAPVVMFYHMLCRQIWFYELPQPFSTIGYLLEPLYLRLLNRLPAIVVSDSTQRDLERVGYRPQDISIISEGISNQPLAKLPPLSQKATPPTLLSFGAMRPMKRTLDQIKAFEIAKQSIPDLRLSIAGSSSGAYGQKVLRVIEASLFKTDITYHGRVSDADKLRLMAEATLVMQTSIKEGWGLTVTEANSQGTPAAVYDIDGLRDSVRNRQTGLIAKQNTPQSLANAIVDLLSNPSDYSTYRQAAWKWSQKINFDQSYKDFIIAINDRSK